MKEVDSFPAHSQRSGAIFGPCVVGKVYVAEKGKDFDKWLAFEQLLRSHAKRRGLRAKTRKLGDCFYFQLIERAETNSQPKAAD
jgi:hypothetical protein